MLPITVRARTADPSTSHEAAAVLESKAEHTRQSMLLVARLVLDAGERGLADFEIGPLFYAEKAGCDHLHKMARKWAREQGYIKYAKRKRRNPDTARRGMVWVAGPDLPFLTEREATPEVCPTCGRKWRH